jgi:alkaline phosphatase D
MDPRRRQLLLRASQLAGLVAMARAGAAPTGASRATNAAGNGTALYPFSLGVASGSPLPDSIILWTRILYDPLNAASTPPMAFSMRWEIAEDEGFRLIAASGSAVATPELAHSVHVDVKGLRPARWYWYRFMLGNVVSPVGRTRTAPASGDLPARLKLAAASCQHWEFGYYAAHRHITAAAPDLVAFLGDYIYEWGRYSLQHPQRAVRRDESFTLADYRARYAQYKSDPDLQAAHHAAPWIVTWDDHEVSNDYNPLQDELLSPDFQERRAAAYQAFYEHQPVRLAFTPGMGEVRMYQRYDWGRLARFHVLDTRQYRSIHACQHKGFGGSSSVYRSACAALADPGRTMLGMAQEAWLADGLQSSRASWNILAQQTLMAQSSQVPLKADGDGRFWTDGWDGYAAGRQRLLDALQTSHASNPLVLSGDVHTFYAAELAREATRPLSAANPAVATEFCGTSITSNSRPQERTAQYVAMNPHIKYGRSDRRGFMLLEITPERSTVLFQGLDDVKEKASGISTLANFEITAGRAGLAG